MMIVAVRIVLLPPVLNKNIQWILLRLIQESVRKEKRVVIVVIVCSDNSTEHQGISMSIIIRADQSSKHFFELVALVLVSSPNLSKQTFLKKSKLFFAFISKVLLIFFNIVHILFYCFL